MKESALVLYEIRAKIFMDGMSCFLKLTRNGPRAVGWVGERERERDQVNVAKC
jgi:hypothetical protein